MTPVPELRPLPQTFAPSACIDPTMAVPFDMSILTISHKKDRSNIKAIIVGGGISGLATAIMMDFAGMEYEILECTTGNEPPMGSGISLGPSVLRLMEQMNLLPDIESCSKIVSGLTVLDGEGKRVGRFEGMDPNRYGYPTRIMSRESFHKILSSRVPPSNIRRGKTVVDTLQNPNGVSCKCSDGSTYYGDIIIGADGTQSLTRDRMHQRLVLAGRGVETDSEPSIYDHFGCTGITGPLDKTCFPGAYEKESEIRVIYNKEYSGNLWYMPIVGGRVAWGISSTEESKISPSQTASNESDYISDGSLTQSQSQSSVETASLSRSLKGAKGAKGVKGVKGVKEKELRTNWYTPSDVDIEEKFKDIMDKQCAIGAGKVRDFIAQTPKEYVSAIDIQERLFRSWYHERIVLIGDACHQIPKQETYDCQTGDGRHESTAQIISWEFSSSGDDA
ncbi:hypothetical protein BGZ76_005854 [Entomortierella beljakovae]|nr:hypothetical protein BGZ76_005854 [Entomortierella beljakovae]